MNTTCKIKLVSPIPPSVNHYLGHRAVVQNGKTVDVCYQTTEAKEYKKKFGEYIKEQLVKQRWDFDDTGLIHYYVDTIFYFDRTGKDANNYFKCSLDAITETGMIWKDDDVVCERVMGIFYDRENPRMEMTIYPVRYRGIFRDEMIKELFLERCCACKRYYRNCRILKDALKGKVCNEIEEGYHCTKYSAVNRR